MRRHPCESSEEWKGERGEEEETVKITEAGGGKENALSLPAHKRGAGGGTSRVLEDIDLVLRRGTAFSRVTAGFACQCKSVQTSQFSQASTEKKSNAERRGRGGEENDGTRGFS